MSEWDDAGFFAEAPEDIAALVAEAETLRKQIEEVRALHVPVDIEPSDTICSECSYQLPKGDRFGKVVEWPCQTMRAMGVKE